MKLIKFDLSLKGVRVATLEALQENFSAEILPIFQSGRLAKWLKSRDLLEQAAAIEAIDKNASELQQLKAICQVLGLDDDEEVLQFLLVQPLGIITAPPVVTLAEPTAPQESPPPPTREEVLRAMPLATYLQRLSRSMGLVNWGRNKELYGESYLNAHYTFMEACKKGATDDELERLEAVLRVEMESVLLKDIAGKLVSEYLDLLDNIPAAIAPPPGKYDELRRIL